MARKMLEKIKVHACQLEIKKKPRLGRGRGCLQSDGHDGSGSRSHNTWNGVDIQHIMSGLDFSSADWDTHQRDSRSYANHQRSCGKAGGGHSSDGAHRGHQVSESDTDRSDCKRVSAEDAVHQVALASEEERHMTGMRRNVRQVKCAQGQRIAHLTQHNPGDAGACGVEHKRNPQSVRLASVRTKEEEENCKIRERLQ